MVLMIFCQEGDLEILNFLLKILEIGFQAILFDKLGIHLENLVHKDKFIHLWRKKENLSQGMFQNQDKDPRYLSQLI